MSEALRYRDRTASLAGGAVLASGVVLAHLPGTVGVPCPIRLMTGVPCPMCGMTTSVRSLMGAHLSRAIAANPLGIVVVAAAAVLVVVPAAVRRSAIVRIGRTPLIWVASVLLAGSWMFELARFGIV